MTFAPPRSAEGYVFGLQPAFNTVSTVDIAAGRCRADDNESDIAVSSTLTADITVSGANGLDTGVEAANTWYSVWVIGDSGGGNAASLLSTQATNPTLPSGFTRKRRVGWVRNLSNSEFRPFQVVGSGTTKEYYYDGVITDLQVLSGGNAGTYTAVNLSERVSPGNTWAYLQTATVNAPATFEFRRTDSGIADGLGPWRALTGDINVSQQTDHLWVVCNSNQRVDYRRSGGVGILNIFVLGYKDEL